MFNCTQRSLETLVGRLKKQGRLQNKSKAWKLKEIEQLKQLRQEGFTYEEIAAKLNRSHNSVKSKMYKR